MTSLSAVLFQEAWQIPVDSSPLIVVSSGEVFGFGCGNMWQLAALGRLPVRTLPPQSMVGSVEAKFAREPS